MNMNSKRSNIREEKSAVDSGGDRWTGRHGRDQFEGVGYVLLLAAALLNRQWRAP